MSRPPFPADTLAHIKATRLVPYKAKIIPKPNDPRDLPSWATTIPSVQKAKIRMYNQFMSRYQLQQARLDRTSRLHAQNAQNVQNDPTYRAARNEKAKLRARKKAHPDQI